MSFINKLKRELVVIFSKLCLKSARNDYFGLDLHYPVIYGMGRGYVIPKEVWMGQCLEAFIASKEGCVLDIGVNVGVYLVKLKALTGDVEYIGFEPNAVCNYYTNELIRLNNFKKARVLPLALSDEMGVQTLYASKLGDKGASLFCDEKSNEDLNYSSDIVTVKGDDFIELLNINDIAAIKIDVEGAELSVLNGLLNTIKKHRPFFYIEIWSSYGGSSDEVRISTIYDLVNSLNYTFLGLNSEFKLEPVKSLSELANQYDPNYIFVPNELLEKFANEVNSIDSCIIEVRI